MASFKKTRFSRFSSMSATLLRAGGDLAKEKLGQISKQAPQDPLFFRKEAAQKVVQNMGELKGAVMKLGQMLSITEDMILPTEVSYLFKKLQKDAPPMSEDDLLSVFKKSFNQTPEEVFESFERTPFAQASIGQVHMAKLHTGEVVAVKVQYPNIKEAIVYDFKNLDRVDQLLGLLFKQKPDITTTIEEIKEVLELECDYHHELQRLLDFNQFLQQRECSVRVPKAYPKYSSEHVLTMEFVKGDSFEQTLNYTQQQKDHLGQILYDFFHISLYEFEQLHTDPQSANYLFNKDQIILLDFGATKKFTPDFIRDYTTLLESLEQSNFSAYANIMIKLGFFQQKDLEQDAGKIIRKHYRMIQKLYTPYTKEGKRALVKNNPFEDARDFIKEIDLKGRKSPHPDFFHLDRSHLGLYSKLKAWNSSIDWLSQKSASRALFKRKYSDM